MWPQPAVGGVVHLGGRVAVAIGAVVAIVGTFLPWLESGSVSRSSFELLDIIERLGFSPGGPVGIALTIWPTAPLLLVLVAIIQLPGFRSAWSAVGAVVAGGLAALYVGGTAGAVLLAPDVGLFRVRIGAWTTFLGTMMMAAGVVVAGIGLRWGRPTGLGRRAPA